MGVSKNFWKGQWVYTYAFGEVGLITGYTVVIAIIWTLRSH